MKNPIPIVVAGVLAVVIAIISWQWVVCRVYVQPGHMLIVTSSFGTTNPDPDNSRVVDDGFQGVWKDVRGEGRHFFNPIGYQVDTRPMVVVIGPDKVGVVESMSGKPLPEGTFLASEPGYKGVIRAPLTPGVWRLNPSAYKVTVADATRIKPGYVGCVTALAGAEPKGALADDGERGIRKNVLQPGLYYLNPREYKVVEIEVGYSQITFKDVTFPSKDGFTIKIDVSVVYGFLPKDVPMILNRFGSVEAVVDKIIRPQVESICRIEGSKYGAKDFIEGESRELFQTTFTQSIVKEAKLRDIDVLIGLVRDINVPIEVREPIQKAKIANEEQITKEEQRKTQVVQNEFEELKGDVLKGVREVAAETTKMIAEVRANGERAVAKIRGEKEVAIAMINKEMSLIEADRQRILGKAEADVIEMLQKADADRFAQNVKAIGSPQAYANYVFAKNLSDDLKIWVRYAGPGTFWTDVPAGAKALEEAAAKKILERENKEK